MNPRRGDLRALCDELDDALGRGDVPTLEALLAPAFRARLTPGLPWGLGERTIEGPDEMIRRVWGVIALHLDVAPIPRQVWISDDVAVVHGAYRGVARHTGRTMEASFVHIWRVRSARFVELDQVTDTAAWQDAVSHPRSAGL